MKLTLVAALLAGASAGAQAGEIYGSIGLPGVMLGYAQPIHPSATLRADVSTIGRRSADGTEEGIAYTGSARLVRTGVFADWFAFDGGFRLTGGVTFNRARVELDGQSNNGTIVIGGTTYPVTPNDRLHVTIEFPRTTPYLGIGWGHRPDGTGASFAFDLGGSVGKAKVTTTASGPNLSQASQSDIDRETAELREGVGKVKLLPQLSVAVGYRF